MNYKLKILDILWKCQINIAKQDAFELQNFQVISE